MNQAELEKINTARERVVAAVDRAKWDEVGPSLADVLWSLAEARPDFEDLPTWLAEARSSGSLRAKVATAVEQTNAILRSVINRYGDEADRLSVSKLRSEFLGGRAELPCGEFAIFASDVAVRAATLRSGVQRLPLAVNHDELRIGRHTKVSFHRTLRIPEHGRAYPLPAGFGRLPILRVEDYAKRVPEKWIEQGGFIIPLYQREALFLEFAGVKWRPTIAKVSVGHVNAISGKSHDLQIRPHRQDYVVIPDQRWLDGINSGDGSVSQFVAMPLGKGYTIEAQVTDEEKYGGFQLAVFDPRPGRFADEDPSRQQQAIKSRKERAAQLEMLTAQLEVLKLLPEKQARVIRSLQKKTLTKVASELGMSEQEIRAVVDRVEAQFRNALGSSGFEGIIPLSHLESEIRFSLRDEMVEPKFSLSDEMGIAAGGRIQQQIFEDTYGAESWDESAYRDIAIHIVNSEAYHRITGLPTPPSPITADDYARKKIPWYSDYDEPARSVAPVSIFERILSIGRIDKNRGVTGDETPRRPINPEDIVRIRTQTAEERCNALVRRAEASSRSGRYAIAVREATLAIDLMPQEAGAYQIRAYVNLCLGRHADAEADASACLKLDPQNIRALSTRAAASLGLGEILLAKSDAEKVLAMKPGDETALFVLQQATR
jgi:hypothetical protein